MSSTSKDFLKTSNVKGFDLAHRKKINFNINKYNEKVVEGKLQFNELDLARERAKNLKWRAIETLDQTLESFESNFTKNGGKVLWAETADQAAQLIVDICKEKECKTVVKSKSMVSEEIHLNKWLEKNGIESVETDLGEYIQQLDGEPPYHIVTPAMHKSKEDVAKLFEEKLGTPPNLTPQELTLVARKNLREKYTKAEVGVTGANFIISDTGSIAITENEGNGRLSCAFPKTHIVVVGIEKVIPSLTDLYLFWPLLATFGTGQNVTVYNSIVSGAKKETETDGPTEMIVILLDNGRTNILKNPKARESLYCIRCGACLNACPVYKNIGGHTYNTTYSGPIGSVITPQMHGLKEWKHLSFASSLCGNCTAVCAVKINLHELLLENRYESVQETNGSFSENISWRLWKKAMLNRKMMNLGKASLKNLVVNNIFTAWKKQHGKLNFPAETFNEIWQRTNNKPN
jgi:L-lactate dehydrogenase complex protein LldF